LVLNDSPIRQQLYKFIDKEADAQIEQIKETWKKPLAERVKAGEAISKVSIKPHLMTSNAGQDYANPQNGYSRARRTYQRKKYAITFSENVSKFRTGDSLRLHQGNPLAKYDVYGCKVIDDDGYQLIVEPGFGYNFSDLDFSQDWILDRDLVDVRHILKGAIGKVNNHELNIINHKTEQQFDEAKFTKADKILRKLNLNESQQDAFAKAYATKNFHLIQGPPGTGKTWVLAHLAKTFAEEGERVLVTALSHRAINNALRKIFDATYYSRIAKIGQTYNANELSWGEGYVRNFESLAKSPFTAYDNGLIVGSTVYALHTRKLQEMEFDTVIFDEAGQVNLPIALAGMVKAKRYIFIGDHQQMQPVITAEYEENDEIVDSVFETIHTNENSTMLTETYRMNATINAFPSKHFYNGSLKPALSAVNRKLKLTNISNQYSKILDPDLPSIFVDLAHKGMSIRCEEEAALAATLICEAIECGVAPHEIAVVVPFRAQARLIKNKLNRLPIGISPMELKSIVIDTVERIQGQERELILISLTASDAKYIDENARFFLNPNRLNVAITRAKTKRIVIGSRFLFERKHENPKYQAALDVFKAFYESCDKVFIDL
jgi:DNA replication ATP-dependent helicase Dna2